MSMTRQQAWDLLTQYNKEPFHLRHAITVEHVMGWYARELGYGAEADHWALVEKVLFAADELTGLIGAAALMRPSKSVADMELKSLKKKFKDKKFAAGCSRDTITQGAQLLGWDLDKLLDLTLKAMQAEEASIEAAVAAIPA